MLTAKRSKSLPSLPLILAQISSSVPMKTTLTSTPVLALEVLDPVRVGIALPGEDTELLGEARRGSRGDDGKRRGRGQDRP